MLSLLYLASALILGTAITRRLGLKLLAFEAPAFAVALGLLLWTWLSLVFSLILPRNLSLPLTVIITALLSFTLLIKTPPWRWQPLPGAPSAWMAWRLFSLTTTLIIGWLMGTHDLITTSDGLSSANATWADFGLHASLITHFGASQHLPLDFPLAAGTHLTYPFITDLLSSWLFTGGWSLHLAIFVPSILLASAFLQLMLGFGVRLFRSIGGSILGLSLMLLCGSAIGLFVAINDLAASHQTLSAFLAHLPKDYSTLTSPNAQISNLIADIILPQRAFLMGFSTFAVVIVLCTHLQQHPSRKLAIFVGSLVGLLPLVHPHTFVVLMALIASFWLETQITTRRPLSIWLITAASALIIAAPQLFWQTLSNHNGTGSHLALGWTIQPGESILSFWANNYGLTLPLIIIIALALSLRKSLHQYLAWYAPLVLIFILANTYALQPFAYDNLKLILYAYLFTYLFAGYGAIWLIKRSAKFTLPIASIALLLTGGGTLAVMREFQHADQFASPDDITLAAWTASHTSSNEVFLTTDRPNQPLATLAGRSIVAGYRGWLYNFHIDYQPRLDTIQTALLGRLTANNPYHAQYLAVSTYEPPEWTINSQALQDRYHLVYSNPSWSVYRLP